MATPSTTRNASLGLQAQSIVRSVKGSTTLAEIALAMGATPDGHSYSFDLSVEIVGEQIETKASANISNADKESAFSFMSAAEKKAVEKFETLCKAAALGRVEGLTSTRTTWAGFVKG